MAKAPKNTVNGYRRRPCICGNPQCSHMSRRYFLADDPKRSGYMYLPKYVRTKSERGRMVRKYRQRAYKRMNLGDDPKDAAPDGEEYIWLGHFPAMYLQDNNKGPLPWVDPNEKKKLRGQAKDDFKEMFGKSDVFEDGPFKGKHIVLPVLSPGVMLKNYNDDQESWDEELRDEISKASSSSDRTTPTERRIKILTRAMGKDAQAIALQVLQLEDEVVELRAMIKELKKGSGDDRKLLEASVNSLRAEMDLCIRLDESGLNRVTMSCRNWHKAHPDICRFLFGIMDDFDELVTIVTKGFFPELRDKTLCGHGDSAITDFEKVLVCLMRMRRRFEYKTLALIIGRDVSSIALYMKEWMPKLGRVGRFHCRLDMDKTQNFMPKEVAEALNAPHTMIETDPPQPTPTNSLFFDDAMPREFRVEEGMDKIAALKDGKDFGTDTSRSNSALTRQMWSDKIKNSGGRCITWVTPSGLVFEYTGLYLARTPEIRLVEQHGKK